ncbi:MAG: ATP synthase F1 subunit gamma [Spirochaetes bacterium]|nr:ATP synthase F1 subunit gamma [Spirochaetota bacterium]
MAGLKELKNRRKTIISTKKVTSAMKMIATSKLKKSQDNMIKARPYSARIKSLTHMLIFSDGNYASEFFVKRPGNRTLYILISSDKGLCGGFNSNIIKTFKSLAETSSEEMKIISIGNRISSFLEKNGFDVYSEYRNAFHQFNFSLAVRIGSEIISLYNNNEVDRVVLVYNRFQSAISQIVVKETILPIELEEHSEDYDTGPLKFETEPGVDKIFNAIFPRYINFLVWRGLLESYASENAARMTTMDSATDNSTDMIDMLTLQINKERQAKITQEISEIVGGSSAK